MTSWGDIIPPIPPGLPNGLNWPQGRPILANGCEVTPDVGPVPSAAFSGGVVCTGGSPTVSLSLTDDGTATAPADFTIRVNAVAVATDQVAPGQTDVVDLAGGPGGPLAGLENQTITIEVLSGGDVLTSRVLTIDCVPPPPPYEIAASLGCRGDTALGVVTLTNNGSDPVEVSARVGGTPVGPTVEVAAGATETGTADLSAYEDRAITVTLLVDGAVAATYAITPDCVPPRPDPRVSVAGLDCPPPSVTVTLSNAGQAGSTEVFAILVDGKVVQRTAPVYGGDSTTIVGSLAPYEDRTVHVSIRANGDLLGSRTLHVNCRRNGGGPGNPGGGQGGNTGGGPGPATGPPVTTGAAAPGRAGHAPPAQTSAAVTAALPNTGSDVTPGLVMLALVLSGAGSLLTALGRPRRRRPLR